MYFALVDCNNFFVSCERAFQPDLEGKAVVVLSNNDGCIVARSNESKAMGIKMGTPIFKVKNLVDSGKLIVRSSNYTLYGDLSARVMSILREYAPELQVYSIDEAFMVFDGVSLDKVIDISKEVVLKIRKWVGLPVSVIKAYAALKMRKNARRHSRLPLLTMFGESGGEGLRN